VDLDVRCECWMLASPAPKVAGILPVCFQSWMWMLMCWMFFTPWSAGVPPASFFPVFLQLPDARSTIALGVLPQKGDARKMLVDGDLADLVELQGF